MEKSEGNNQEKYFKETNKHMTLRARKENEGQESREPTIENSRSNILHGGHDPLILVAWLHQEPVSHMCWIIDTQTYGDDEIVTRNGVDGKTPEMHKTSNIDKSENDTTDYDDGSP